MVSAQAPHDWHDSSCFETHSSRCDSPPVLDFVSIGSSCGRRLASLQHPSPEAAIVRRVRTDPARNAASRSWISSSTQLALGPVVAGWGPTAGGRGREGRMNGNKTRRLFLSIKAHSLNGLSVST